MVGAVGVVGAVGAVGVVAVWDSCPSSRRQGANGAHPPTRPPCPPGPSLQSTSSGGAAPTRVTSSPALSSRVRAVSWCCHRRCCHCHQHPSGVGWLGSQACHLPYVPSLSLPYPALLPASPHWTRPAGPHPTPPYAPTPPTGLYRGFVKTILTRVNTINGRTYSEDPTVMAWDLLNEPRCNGCPAGTIAKWCARALPACLAACLPACLPALPCFVGLLPGLPPSTLCPAHAHLPLSHPPLSLSLPPPARHGLTSCAPSPPPLPLPACTHPTPGTTRWPDM